jgi:TRAP-type C4-dicarboxylate transport system permease small subunit
MVVGGVSLITLILECNLNIIGRYFRKPIEGSYDFLSLGAVFLIAAGLLPTELSGGHVVVSNIVRRLFKKRIIRKIYDSIICLINLCAVLWLTWAVVNYVVAESIPSGEKAMTLQISCYPFHLVWAIGLFLLALGILKRTVETITNTKRE